MSHQVDRADAPAEKQCVWFRDDGIDASDVWDTDCGHAFVVTEGSPSENHMKFCCYCGRELEELLSSETESEDDNED